jgi:hypothetical protein
VKTSLSGLDTALEAVPDRGRGGTCSVALLGLSTEDLGRLDDSLTRRNAAAVSAALATLGIEISQYVLRRHMKRPDGRRVCKCPT